jgi:hypothetical protein
LNPFNVGLDLVFERLDLSLILKGELLDSFIEKTVLILLLLGKALVLVKQFNLAFEYGLIVSGDSVEESILATVLLDNLLVHVAEVLLGLLDETVDLGLEVIVGPLGFELGDALLELGVLVP